MDMIKFINVMTELAKNGIDNNPNFSEWEKWWRKCGADATKELAKQYYHSMQQIQNGGLNGRQ